MGAIGGMLGLSGGAAGTGFAGPQEVADKTGMNNLQSTYGALGNVANGTGPNPAMEQYNQNIQNLAHQQAGAISSVQGLSPALAARLISQQSSAAMQNAAAGGAKTQSEQQLGALGQQGAIANNQAQAALGIQNNINTANAGLAQTQLGNQGKVTGGIMNGLGAAMGMAGGGQVSAPAMAAPGPQSGFAKFLQGYGAASGVPAAAGVAGAMTPGQDPLEAGFSGFAQGIGKLIKGKGPANMGTMAGGAGDVSPAAPGLGFGAAPMMAAAKGGQVPALVSPGEMWLPPQKVQQVAKGKNPLEVGERIPGKPKVPGNSYANDVVPKNLDVGGVVIPNSIMQSKNPAQGARDMVADIIAKRKAKK